MKDHHPERVSIARENVRDPECLAKGSKTIKCRQCEKEFIANKWMARLFCSKECSAIFHKTAEKRFCTNCQKEMEVKPCHRDIKKYCSRECAAINKRAREVLKCQVCQKEFYPLKKKSRFCSLDCKYASYPRQGYKEVYAKIP